MVITVLPAWLKPFILFFIPSQSQMFPTFATETLSCQPEWTFLLLPLQEEVKYVAGQLDHSPTSHAASYS